MFIKLMQEILVMLTNFSLQLPTSDWQLLTLLPGLSRFNALAIFITIVTIVIIVDLICISKGAMEWNGTSNRVQPCTGIKAMTLMEKMAKMMARALTFESPGNNVKSQQSAVGSWRAKTEKFPTSPARVC